MRAPEALSTGPQRAPDWDSVHLKNFPPKQHLHEHRNGLPVRGYIRSCGKSNSSTQRVSSLRKVKELQIYWLIPKTILLRGIQLTLVQRYWVPTVRIVFSNKIFTFYNGNKLVALPNAWRRSVLALSECYNKNNGSESTVVKTVELRWVVYHV
jgi:hypothetical protein